VGIDQAGLRKQAKGRITLSILSYLQGTASAAVLSGAEKNSISKSIDTLQTRLINYFPDGIVDHFQFGSSTRNTILPREMDGNSDIDYMVIFQNDGSTTQTFLNRLKRFAATRYSTSEIYQSSPTIVLELNHIKFDLVPAIQNWSGGYKIPDGNGGWVSTNPNDFNQQLTDKNKNHGSLIKPTIRLAKYWNACNGYPFESFSLEKWIIARQFGTCANQKDYLFHVFDKISPDGHSQTTKAKIERAKKIIAQVRAYEGQGMSISAETEVKKLIPE